ncbi:MAG TPA: transporter [Opitutales bacterium]|nr:transporter [Opitutales bacterium]
MFNPTPVESMREFNADRPDQTESPYTVDAGHFQVETDFLNATFDRDRSGGGDVSTRIYRAGTLNLKAGLLDNVDVQFILDPYVYSRIEDHVAGTVSQTAGFGDLQTRLKINFWGNDGGTTAFGVMPYVKWPLPQSGLRNGKTEGGVIFPLQVNFAEGWSVGAMTEFDCVAADAGSYDTQFVNSVVLDHDLTDKLGMYVEFYTVASSAPGFHWQGQADVGWTYLLSKNLQIDFGCNFGVTKSAPDFNPFTGLTYRF